MSDVQEIDRVLHQAMCPHCGKVGRRGSMAAHIRFCRDDIGVRFWQYVEMGDGCWTWKGAKHRDGYGRFNTKDGMVIAHRFAYSLVKGPITADLDVLHRCDNRECVNPAHLWLGTHQENMRDCYFKGRNRTCSLTAEQVLEVRAAMKNWRRGMGKYFADKFGVTQGVIGDIRLGRSYQHIQPSPDGDKDGA
jgi:hypothetical protein